MTGERARSDVRVRELLDELRETTPPARVDLAGRVSRRASRQRTTLTFVRLLVVITRALPHAAGLAIGRRR